MKTISKILIFIFCIFPLNNLSCYAEVSAQSAIVIEKSSGRILYDKNADKKLPMASTTKIMTALVALENGNTDDIITISSTAAGTEGSSMYLEAGEKMTLLELLYGLMLSSGNDAAVAIAEHFGGTDKFVALMNNKAKEIGATKTNFTNPNGLPDNSHYSTAWDMAKITAVALENETFLEIVSSKSYRVAGEGKAYSRTLSNHNKLLNMYQGCIGVKTGFTKAAGRCLVSAAEKEEMTLICVTLNAPDDWNDHINLYNQLFPEYSLRHILHSGVPLDSIQVENSTLDSLSVTVNEDFLYPLAKDEEISTTLTLSPPLYAPVENLTQCGDAILSLKGKEIKKIPLVTIGNAPQKTIFSDEDSLLNKILGFFARLFPL